MKRSWNWRIWSGFAVTLLAAFSYVPLFARFPATRDIPWVNLLLFVVAGWLLITGVYRAFAQPERYRGKVSGIVLGALSLGTIGLFCAGTLYIARSLPSPQTALKVGQTAPDFTLTDTGGNPVTLSQLRQGHRAVLLIFYRGYW